MSLRVNVWRLYGARLTAVLLLVTLYGFARIPTPTRAELSRLASSFGFKQMPLPELPGMSKRNKREVNPSLRYISGWISTVGASVALNDLDEDGLPNDICYVDPRSDKAIVAPAPGTPQRYQPFTLEPPALSYHPATVAPMGCLPGDLNEDGLIDILVYYWGRTPIAFLRKKEGGQSKAQLGGDSYLGREVIPGGERWYTNAATLADLDGDGHTDLIIGNYFPDGARILDTGARDDEQMQDSMSLAFNGGRNRLLLWKKPRAGEESSIRFEDAQGVLDERVARGWTLALGAADLDGDLLPEIYFANDFGPDRLLHNRSKPGELRFELIEGEQTLAKPKSKVLGQDSFKGMGVDFGDLNGDEWPDIFVSNIAEEYALEESHQVFLSTGQVNSMKRGVAPYVDASESLGLSRSGWGWDVRFGDFNNDGVLEVLQATGFLKGNVNRWPELHELAMGNDLLLSNPRNWPRFQEGDDLSGNGHSCFFVRAGDNRYYDVAPELMLAEPHISRGIATADVDGDGRLDFAVANQWETSYFYHNEGRSAGTFLGLRLRLPVVGSDSSRTRILRNAEEARLTSRSAIGAEARVFLDGGRKLFGQVEGGNGHSGKRSHDLQFGLGQFQRDRKLTVELRWRDVRGQPHRQTVQLLPGSWYTVLLGQEEGIINESE